MTALMLSDISFNKKLKKYNVVSKYTLKKKQ